MQRSGIAEINARLPVEQLDVLRTGRRAVDDEPVEETIREEWPTL